MNNYRTLLAKRKENYITNTKRLFWRKSRGKRQSFLRWVSVRIIAGDRNLHGRRLIFGKFDFFILFFGHEFPISDGHVAFHLPRVFPRGDIDCMIVFFPERGKRILRFRKARYPPSPQARRAIRFRYKFPRFCARRRG